MRGAAAAAPHRRPSSHQSPRPGSALHAVHASDGGASNLARPPTAGQDQYSEVAQKVDIAVTNLRIDLAPSDIMHMTVLSRLIEPLRFTVGPSLLDNAISANSLLEAFAQHFDTLKTRKLAEGELSEQEREKVNAHFADGLAKVEENIRVAWEVIERDHTEALMVTFGDVFDYEFPSFPESTEEQREQLLSLCDNEVVTMRDVMTKLKIDDRDDQLVSFIFASGCAAIPREVFRDIVACLGTHPRGVSFAQVGVRNMVTAGKAMSQLIPHLIVLFAILIVSPQIVRSSHLQLYENTIHFMNNDWIQGCPDGPMSALGCNFLGKNFLVSARPELDVLRFLRTELINIIWRNQTSVTNSPLGGMYPVGALIIRGVRGSHGANVDDENRISCEALNLTTTTWHFEVPAGFGCRSDWAIVIPYSLSQTEALQRASQVQLPPKEIEEAYAIITHFAAYQPSEGLYSYAKAMYTFPPGGAVMPRFAISPIDPSAHKRILAPMVLHVLHFIWAIFLAARYGRVGVSWFTALFFDSILTGMIIASYVLLSGLDDLPDEVNQTDYAPKGFDKAQANHDTGMSLLGFYVLFFVCSTVMFARYIRGLQMLFDIVRTAALEILGLIFMFVVWTFGFVCVAMALFGSGIIELSSVGVAIQHLMLYFAGQHDFMLLLDNNPIIGPAFFFVFNIFVMFFALNLLIAVLTAPLGSVKEQNTLPETVYQRTKSLLGESSFTERMSLTMGYYVAWPLANVLLDCGLATQGHWIRMLAALDTFYNIEASEDSTALSVRVSGAAVALLGMMTPVERDDLKQSDSDAMAVSGRSQKITGLRRVRHLPHLWDSPLLRVVLQDGYIPDQIALSLILIAIAEETPSTAFRNARLMRVLRDYDAFATTIHHVHELQEDLKVAAFENSKHFGAFIDATEVAKANGNTTEAIMELEDIEHGERLDSFRMKLSQSIGSPLIATPQISMVAGPAAADEAAAAASGSNPLSVEATTPAAAEDPAPGGNAQTDTETEEKDQQDDAEKAAHGYFFTRTLRNEMSNGLQILFYSLTTFIFCFVLFAPFVSNFDSTAHLLRSLSLGLRDLEINTVCNTPDCTAAWSMNKTFLSVGDQGEYYFWLDQLLYRQLYLRDELGLPFNGTGSVYWDHRVEMRGPMHFRQLRARPATECDPPSFGARVAASNTRCDESIDRMSDFFEGPMPIPSGGLPPLIPASAYEYSNGCAEKEPKSYLGRFNDYPCQGHAVSIHNASQLRALINARWIDQGTRLATFTANFWFGNKTAVEYTMHMEFSEGGGGSFGEAFGFPIASEAALFDLSDDRLMFMVLLILDLALSAVLLVRYLVARFIQKLPVADVADMEPAVPVVPLTIAFLTFIAVNVFFSPTEQSTRNHLAQVILSIIYLEYNLTTAIIFPLASLMSKKVKVLILTLAKAIISIIYVIPYFVVILWAFLLGGFLIFGRYMLDMGRVRWAVLELGLMGFVGQLEIPEMQNARFFETQIYIGLFACAMLVVLANMFLAMVTSASGDAQETDPRVKLSEGTLALFGYRVMYGQFLASFLDLSVKWARRTRPGAARRGESALMLGRDRALFPAEVLVTTMHPLQVNDVLVAFCADRLNKYAYAALGPFVLEHYIEFQSTNPHKRAHDFKLVTHFENRRALARLKENSADESASGDAAAAAGDGEKVDTASASERDESIERVAVMSVERAGLPEDDSNAKSGEPHASPQADADLSPDPNAQSGSKPSTEDGVVLDDVKEASS